MIIKEEIHEVISSDSFKTKQATIKPSRKAFEILFSGIYSNKVRAVVRELSTNAYDSHIEAGKKDEPIIVHLPNVLEPWFSVRDNGIGMTEDFVMNNYQTYFESTRSNSNDYVGALGLGSKSPFSLASSFNIESRKDKVKSFYNIYIGPDGFPAISKMFETPTEEPNGVEVKVPVSTDQFSDFKQEAEHVYRYFQLKPIVNVELDCIKNGQNNELQQRVYDEDWTWEIYNLRYEPFTIVMGNIGYPCHEHFRDYCGVRLTVPIGTFEISASRESVALNSVDIEKITTRFNKKVLDFFTKNILEEAKKIRNFKTLAEFFVSDAVKAVHNSSFRSFFANKIAELGKWKHAASSIEFTSVGLNLTRLQLLEKTSRKHNTSNNWFPHVVDGAYVGIRYRHAKKMCIGTFRFVSDSKDRKGYYRLEKSYNVWLTYNQLEQRAAEKLVFYCDPNRDKSWVDKICHYIQEKQIDYSKVLCFVDTSGREAEVCTDPADHNKKVKVKYDSYSALKDFCDVYFDDADYFKNKFIDTATLPSCPRKKKNVELVGGVRVVKPKVVARVYDKNAKIYCFDNRMDLWREVTEFDFDKKFYYVVGLNAIPIYNVDECFTKLKLPGNPGYADFYINSESGTASKEKLRGFISFVEFIREYDNEEIPIVYVSPSDKDIFLKKHKKAVHLFDTLEQFLKETVLNKQFIQYANLLTFFKTRLDNASRREKEKIFQLLLQTPQNTFHLSARKHPIFSKIKKLSTYLNTVIPKQFEAKSFEQLKKLYRLYDTHLSTSTLSTFDSAFEQVISRRNPFNATIRAEMVSTLPANVKKTVESYIALEDEIAKMIEDLEIGRIFYRIIRHEPNSSILKLIEMALICDAKYKKSRITQNKNQEVEQS